VHGLDGIDEVSISGPTLVCEVYEGGLREYTVTPEDCGFARAPASAVQGGSAADNAAIIGAILTGNDGGPRRQVVLLNAAAALVAGDVAPDLASGVRLASRAIDRGDAAGVLARFIAQTHRMAAPC
jgi:anthranilate phosphoribosyltransferase